MIEGQPYMPDRPLRESELIGQISTLRSKEIEREAIYRGKRDPYLEQIKRQLFKLEGELRELQNNKDIAA